MDNVVDIKCPTDCSLFIDEKDIERLLDKVSYEKYEFKISRLKVLSIKNRFHCLTPNCNGFFIKKNTTDALLKCSICKRLNCLNCKIIIDTFEKNEHDCNLSNQKDDKDPLQVFFSYFKIK